MGDIGLEKFEEPTKVLTSEKKRAFNSALDIRTITRREFTKLFNKTNEEMQTWAVDNESLVSAESSKASIEKLAQKLTDLDEKVNVTVALSQPDKLEKAIEQA